MLKYKLLKLMIMSGHSGIYQITLTSMLNGVWNMNPRIFLYLKID